MNIEYGLTDDELVNTKYAPLAALAVYYQQNLTLRPLERVQIPMKERGFSPAEHSERLCDLVRGQRQAQRRARLGPGVALGAVCRPI